MQEFFTAFLSPFLFNLFVALGIGFIVGLEREFSIINGKEHFAGLRAFSLMSILGCVTAFLSANFNSNIILVVTPSVFIYISVFHYSKMQKENFGIITELSLLLVFFLGVAIGFSYVKEALAVAVIITVLLALKTKFRNTIKKMNEKELYAFLKFILLTLLFLPFLPDKNYGPAGLFNPQIIGSVIVIVSALNFVSYFIIKFYGYEKGIIFTSLFGGLFSSTTVTWNFSRQSKEYEILSEKYGIGITLANSIMLFRVLIISAIFNVHVFLRLLAPGIISILMSLLIIYFMRRNIKEQDEPVSVQAGNPLSVTNALLFGLLFFLVTLLAHYTNQYFGTEGLVFSGIVAGIADLDAANISISKLGISEVKPAIAAYIILLAIASNILLKICIAFFWGSGSLRKKTIIGLFPVTLVLVISALTLYLSGSD